MYYRHRSFAITFFLRWQKPLISFVLFAFTSFHSIDLSYAQAANIRVNPLLSYKDQIKELSNECKNAGNPPGCQERIEALQKEEDTLRTHCEKNPYDFRCDALKRKKKEYVNRMEELCMHNPYDNKCIKKREDKMRALRQNNAFCKKSPESSRCRPKPAPTPIAPYMDRYCANRTKDKRCIKYLEEKKNRLNPYHKTEKENVF